MKFWKRFGIAVLSLGIAMSVGLFAVACGDETPDDSDDIGNNNGNNNGNNTVTPIEGSDEEHAIVLSFAENSDTISGSVTIDETDQDSGRGKAIQSVYYQLVAPQDGYYLLEVSSLDAEILKWDGTFYPIKTLTDDTEKTSDTEESEWTDTTGTRLCAFDLKKDDVMQFMLTANSNTLSSVFPLTYSFRIYLGEPPALGSEDKPEEINEEKTYTVSLEAGETYYYIITDQVGYYLDFGTAEGFTVYDLGAAATNDDRMTPENIFTQRKLSANEWNDWFIVVVAEEDCEVSFTATHA